MSELDQDAIAIFYFPLHGLRAEEEPVLVEDVMLLEPSFYDWQFIEKTDVADQLGAGAAAERLGLPIGGERPPLCLAADIEWPEERMSLHPISFLPEVEPAVTDVLLGLRLLKDGIFLDFEYAGRYVTAPGGLSSRLPGPYRQAHVDLADGEHYTLLRDDVPELEELSFICRSYRETGVDNAGAIAIENFRHAHAVHVGDVDRLAFLFVALEALFGSYNEREPFGRVPLADRAADGEARDYLAGDGRRLRNAVAHGSPPAGPLGDDVSRLLAVLREGILDYMWFCVALEVMRSEVAELVGDRASSSRMRSFNEVHALLHEGNEHAIRLLAPKA